jgi:hypothetical protein
MEASTGRRSDKVADWRAMKADAEQMLRRAAQGSKSAMNGKRGSQGLIFTPHQIEIMRGIMVSREYRNWDERRIAMMARELKAPQRTWCLTKLPILAGGLTKAEAPRPERKRQASVYFIRDDAQVKIGHSVNPRARLRELQCATHRLLKLLATCKGGQQRERLLHKKFAKYRIKGEWFKLSAPILKYIDQIKTVHRRHK